MSEAPKLYQLQVLDLELDEKSHQLRQVESRLGETAELRAAREKLEAAEAHRGEIERRVRQLEADVETHSAKIADLQKRLFGGAVGKQKEATATEKQIQALRQVRSALEDELLEAMAESEDLPTKLAAIRDEVDQAVATWTDEQTRLHDVAENLRRETAGLHAARERMLPLISSGALETYESLRRSHRGRAVARVERNTCQGCRVALPMSEVQRVRTNPQLSHCSFCGRILYIER